MLSMFVESNADPVPVFLALSVILKLDIVSMMYVFFDERGNYCSDMGKRVILLVRRPPTNRPRLAIPLRLKMKVNRLARLSLLESNRTSGGYDVLQYTVRVRYDCQD